MGTTKIYQMVAQGKFPKPVKLTPRSVAWVEDEVNSFIDARIAERDSQSAA